MNWRRKISHSPSRYADTGSSQEKTLAIPSGHRLTQPENTATCRPKSCNNSQHNYMIIDKGSEDGVEEKSGIITSEGAVGIIDAVSRHYSYALSFRNSGISISARIGKEGAVGPMKWDGRSSRGAILSEIPHHIGISPGDTVYTSGYSTIFPPDIPLGTTGESRLVNYEIKVTLFEDFSRLRYVTIVNHTGKEELKELEEER